MEFLQYTIVDALTLNLLKDHPEDYGKQRMFMSIGLGVSIVIVSLAMDSLSISKDFVDYTPAFISFIVFLVAAIGTVMIMKIEIKPEANPHLATVSTQIRKPEGIFQVIPRFFRLPSLIFSAALFTCGMNFGKSLWLGVWTLKILGAPQLTVGIVAIIVCISASITFFASGQIIKCLGSEWTLFLVLLAYSIRGFTWSFLKNPWHALPVEILLGMAMGLTLANMGAYANRIAPKGARASTQAVLSAIYDGFGKFYSIFAGFVHSIFLIPNSGTRPRIGIKL